MSRRDLQAGLNLKDREHFRRTYLQPALKKSLIVMSNPDKPRAADQKYSITARGLSYIVEAQEEGGEVNKWKARELTNRIGSNIN